MAPEQDELTQGITELFEAEESQEPTEGTETQVEEVETQEPVEEPEEEPTAETVEPAAETDEPPEVSETININGVDYPKTELEKFAKVAQWVEENPKAWEQIEGLQTQFQETQELQPLASQEEEWVDPDSRLAMLEGKLNALLQERQETASSQFTAAFHDAIEFFKRDHPEVDDDGVTQVLKWVRDRNLLPTYLKSNTARPVVGALNALEDAYKVTHYDKNPKRQPVTTSEARARRKAASTAPTNGSTPRVPEVPETPEEAYKMMVEDIREAQRANT